MNISTPIQWVLSLSLFLFSVGYLMGNIPFATAYPQGPNVSMGSNPIEAFAINCNSTTPTLLSTASLKFIITDIIVADGGGTEDAQLFLNGAAWFSVPEISTQSFNSGFPVPTNSTVTCYAYYSKRVIVSGYYAHP